MPQSDGKNTLKRMEFAFKNKTFKFNLNPEEYTQDETSKSQVTQTKGGAWVDDFGAGLKTIYMKGSTGFKGGQGYKKFIELRNLIRDYYDDTKPGKTIKDELVFHNFTDGESWVVHTEPAGFRLLRSKSNPLLYMYEIRLICLRETKQPASKASSGGVGKSVGTPAKMSTKNTTTYEIGGKYISGKLMVANNIPKTLASFVSQLKALAGGELIYGKKTTGVNALGSLDLQFFAEKNDMLEVLNVSFNPYVSKLALETLTQVKDGTLPTRMREDDLTLLVDKLRVFHKDTVDPELVVGLQSVMLELIGLSLQIETDPNKLKDSFSTSDIKRLRRNLRWVTNQFAELKKPDFNFVEELRWLERAVMYVADSELFEESLGDRIYNVNVSMGTVTNDGIS